MKKEVTQEQKEKIIYNYTVLKKGQKASGAEFGFSYKIVKRVLEENNIPIRTKVGGRRQFDVDDNYFSPERQSANQAYIIGFLGADGNVNSRENRIDLELWKEDHDILEQIRTEIKSEREVKIYKCANGYEKHKLYFTSEQIKNDLKKFHIIPNKTYSKEYTFPELIEEKYVIDYIRGLFDGDGSVKWTNGTICFQIDSSSKEVLEGINNFFEKKDIHLSFGENQKVNFTLHRLYCYGDNAIKIYNMLYTPNSLFLARKKEKWEELLSLYKTKEIK